MTVQCPTRSGIYIQVQVTNVTLTILVDSGLSVSILSEQEFSRHFQSVLLLPVPHVTLFDYCQHLLLRCRVSMAMYLVSLPHGQARSLVHQPWHTSSVHFSVPSLALFRGSPNKVADALSRQRQSFLRRKKSSRWLNQPA